MKTITMKSSPESILKQFRENPVVNLKTEKGYIYLISGILSKLKNGHHYVAHNNKWIELY